MALWEAIESPFRCLNEFDVYMDLMNRKMSMRMMLEEAKVLSNRQFVFFTPQDMRCSVYYGLYLSCFPSEYVDAGIEPSSIPASTYSFTLTSGRNAKQTLYCEPAFMCIMCVCVCVHVHVCMCLCVYNYACLCEC